MSRLKPLLRVILSWRCGAEVLRSIILRRKVRPAGTILAVKLRVPMRDRSSCLVQWVRRNHLAREDLMSFGLSFSLSCVVTNKTAAIHVRCQHSMCNFLSCKTLLGPHPSALDQEGLPFSLSDAYWSIYDKESYAPFTMHHPMHLPNKCTIHLHMPCTFQQPILVPRLFFWNKTTMHLPFTYICHAPLQGDT